MAFTDMLLGAGLFGTGWYIGRRVQAAELKEADPELYESLLQLATAARVTKEMESSLSKEKFVNSIKNGAKKIFAGALSKGKELMLVSKKTKSKKEEKKKEEEKEEVSDPESFSDSKLSASSE